jgi:hypothetical protein
MSLLARVFAVALMMAGAVLMPFASGQAAAGVVPDPFACYNVRPLSLIDMFDLIDNLSDTGDTYVVTSVYGPSLSEGTQITSADRTEIEATLDAFVACVNERDPQRLLALLSERYQASLIADILGSGDAMSAIAHQIPKIVRADDAGDPIQTPDVIKAWRPVSQPDQIWAVVSGPVPGHDRDVELFVVFTPSEETGWSIDLIASYVE